MDVQIEAEMLQPYLLRNPHAVFDLRREEIDFHVYYFLGRVRLRLGDFEINLASQITAILGFAITLKRILNRLAQPGEGVLGSMTNEQDIRFVRKEGSDLVNVDPIWTDGHVDVPYDDLIQAADKFLQCQLDELSVRFPQLTENEDYPAWRAL